MIDASQKEGDGDRCELKASQKMLCRHDDLTNTVIAADALDCQKETARILLFMHKEQDLYATLPEYVEDIVADKGKAFSMLMRRY